MRRCVCVPLRLQEFQFLCDKTSGGPGRIHRRLVNEAGDVSEDMEMGRHFHVKEMVLDTLVCRRLSFCVLSIPLYRFAGGLQTCNAGLQPGRDGLQPLATASNRGWF